MQDVFDELARFDDGFTPSSLDIAPGLETLADGEYQFQIAAAEVARTEQTREAIFRMNLLVLAGPSGIGSTVERVNFFAKQQNVNILGGDLVALGFDAELWRPPARPFSIEFAKVLPLLVGVRFQGRKTHKVVGERTYHNLYIRSKLGVTGVSSRAKAAAPVVPTAWPPDDSLPF